MFKYFILTISVGFELLGTALLKQSNGFNNWLFAGGALIAYAIAFFALAKSLTFFPLSIAYTIWSGAGIAGTLVLDLILFDQKVAFPQSIGTFLILAGIILINQNFGG